MTMEVLDLLCTSVNLLFTVVLNSLVVSQCQNVQHKYVMMAPVCHIPVFVYRQV